MGDDDGTDNPMWDAIELLGGSDFTVVGPQTGNVYKSELLCLVTARNLRQVLVSIVAHASADSLDIAMIIVVITPCVLCFCLSRMVTTILRMSRSMSPLKAYAC
jgi:hypothetical protein